MSQPVRVASIVAHMHIGGDENRLHTYCQHRDPARFDHRVLVLVQPRPETDAASGPIFHRYRQLDVPCDVLGERARGELQGTGAVRAWREVALASRVVGKMALWLRRHRIEVVDARLPLAAMLAVMAAPLAGVRAVVGTLYFGDAFDEPLWRRAGELLLPRLHTIVSDSQAALDWYGRWLGPRSPRMALVQNGAPVPVARQSRAQVRTQLGLPHDALVVAQVARLVPYKGQMHLVQAAARVLQRHADVWFLVCGYAGRNHQYRAELDAEIARLGIGHRVRVAGWPGDIADVWQAVDVHAHASLLDSSPMALHESMALGIPAVVSDAGGIPELVAAGESGVVVPAGDVDGLAAAILALVGDPAMRARLGAGARARYVERHLPADMARRIEREFELAAGRRAA